jgi:peptide/nickel transport system permease protein
MAMQATLTLGERIVQRPSVPTKIRRTLSRHPNLLIGHIMIVIVVVIAIAAPLIMTHSPTFQNPSDRLLSPGSDYLFGTDGQGRDVFSRTVKGSQLSLLVGVAVSALTMVIGGLIGLVCGFMPRIDGIVMRVMDAMMAFPSIVLAIGIMAVRGADVTNVVFALTAVNTPRMARVVRSVVMGTSQSQYVEAAQSIGSSTPRILFRHITPNCLSPVIVQTSFVFAEAVLGEATLSFLGAGAPPDIPSWGGMLSESRVFLSQAPWTMLVPGAALTITVFALNLIGDGIRDMLDPKLRQR